MKKNILLLLLPLFIWSCNTKDPNPKNDLIPEKLVSVTFEGKKTKNEIIDDGTKIFGSAAVNLALLLQYDVNYYKVIYKTTTTDGREIEASGALLLPDNESSTALVGYFHSTIFEENQAPSYFNSEAAESIITLALASAGYFTAAPDYVGYGISKNEHHPYEHALGLAKPNTDMLLAIKEHFMIEKAYWNNILLLGGYSEGGYATLATQKYIEENHSKDFNLKASSAGSGAYNKSLVLNNLINEPSAGEIQQNRSYIWVIEAYNRIYNLDHPMSYYFKEPYASQIEDDGYMATLEGSLHEMLNKEFVESFNAGNETKLVNAFKENDLIDWKTNIITRLTHGDADTYVPYINSTTALEGMKNAGSSSVTLKTIEGGTHESTIQNFILETYTLFLSNRN